MRLELAPRLRRVEMNNRRFLRGLSVVSFVALVACSGPGPDSTQVRDELVKSVTRNQFGLWEVSEFDVVQREDLGGDRVAVTAHYDFRRTKVDPNDALREVGMFDIQGRALVMEASQFKPGDSISKGKGDKMRIIYAKAGDRWIAKSAAPVKD
ncbi:MAG: hypothetical protein ACLGHO_02260 [Gammaproteobacteria bacterium]